MKMSRAAETIPTSGIRAMFSLAENYKDVISFGLGEPDFATPDNIIKAGCTALKKGYTKYCPNAGIYKLREAIAEKMNRHNNFLATTAENVHVTFGAGSALMLTMYAILDVGDEIIIPAPFFPNYLGYVHMSGGKSVIVDTTEENQFKVTPEAIEKAITSKTKAILINSPCNPTGAVLDEEDIIKIAEIALKHDLIVVSDEPYEDIIFDGKSNFSIGSIPEMKDSVITINSFSKTYAMTGFRIGYIVCPSNMRERFTLLQENVGSSVAGAVQKAAIEAISGNQQEVTKMARIYERRRNLLVDGLNQINGVSCLKPGGAFYAFANIKKIGMSSEETAIMLLDKVQVQTTPGSAFGQAGEGYLRLSFATSDEKILQGLKRIKSVLG